MKNRSFSITGFLFVLITGTLLHFAYEWTGQNRLVGFIAPVNESVWEHVKLLVIPLTVWFALRFLSGWYDISAYLPSVCLGLLSGAACMISLYYTYSGAWGRTWLAFDVLIFILSILAAFAVQKKTAGMGNFPAPTVILSAFVILLLLSCLAAFTVYPPGLGLFQVPG